MLGIDAPAGPLTVTLPRGTRFDRAAAPPGRPIGFGRYLMDVEGFLAPGGSTQLVWSLTAALSRRAGEVTITSRLLGADSAAALLQPQLGTPIPAATTTTARFARSGGRLEFRLAQLPITYTPAPPATAAPARFELSLSATRMVRKTFYHHFRVPTGTGGFRIQRVRDHRLVSHDLLRTPPACKGSWAYALRSGEKTVSGRMPCLAPLSVAPSAARRRA